MSAVKRATTTKAPGKPAVDDKKDEPKPSVLPNDILRAINEARKKDPKDKHGDGAFRLNYDRLRLHQNKEDKKKKSAYMPFEVNIRGQWMPVNVRIMNAKTTAGVKSPDEREYGIDLQFRRSSTFMTKNANGEDEEQKYGEAVCAIYEAFGRIVAKGLADGRPQLKNNNQTIHTKVQYKAKNKETRKEEDLEDPIFRVDLRVNKDLNEFIDLKDSIRDVRRKLDKVPKGAIMPYDLAQDDDGKALTPDSIHTFFRSGTPCFGVHCMDQLAMTTGSGFSLPSFFTLLAAKKPKGKRPAFENHFTQEEVNQWADAEAYDDEAGDDGAEEGADGGDGAGDTAGDDAAEEAAAGDYDDVLEAMKQEAAADDDTPAEPTPEPNDADLDALEETKPPEPEPVPEPKKPATKTPVKKGGKR